MAVTGREITGSDITVRDITESDITGSDTTGCDITGCDIFIDVFHFNSVLFVPHIYILFVNHNIKFHDVLLKVPYFLYFKSIMYFLFNCYHAYINFILYYCTVVPCF